MRLNMRRWSSILGLVLLAAGLAASPVMASTTSGAIYKADLVVHNGSYASANNAVPFTLSSQALINGSFAEPDLLNTAIVDGSGTDIPYMPATGSASTTWDIFVDNINQSSNNLYYLYTGGADMGGLIRYFPATGGMAVADSASLEPSSDFSIECKGYFDLTSGAGKYLVYKDQAVIVQNTAAGELTATTFGSAAVDLDYDATHSGGLTCFGANWAGQTVTADISGYLTGVTIYLGKTGTPAGNFTITLNTASGDLPTTTILATKTVTANSISAGDNTFTFTTPYYITAGTHYSFVLSSPSGNGSNHIDPNYDNTNPYAGGQSATSANSGSTWTGYAAFDLNFKTIVAPATSCVITGQTSGEHDYIITLSGGQLAMFDGGENWLPNGGFEAGSPPTGWTAGSGATLAQVSPAKIGNYAVSMTTPDGTNDYAIQTVNSTALNGKAVTFGAWVKTTAEFSGISIHDDDGHNADSGWCPNDGQWHWLTATVTVGASATNYQLWIVGYRAGTTYFDGARLVIGSSLPAQTTEPLYLGEATAVTPADNANGWTFCSGGSMAYVELIKVNVAGVLKGSWAWQYATTFTDLSGNSNTATPTFRTTTTDADVTASIQTLAPLDVAEMTSAVTTTTPAGMINPTDIPSDTRPPVTDSNWSKVPLGGVILSIVDVSGIPPALFFFPVMLICVILAAVVTYGLTRDMLYMGIVGCFVIGIFISISVLYVIPLIAGVVGTIVILTKRKTVSL